GIAYGKTAAVLRMVEHWLGEETFRDGIRAYLAKYSWSNAAAEDFWGTMAAVSKKPVDQVMKSFVDQPGAPLLHVDRSCVDGKSTAAVSQERFMIRGAHGTDQTWRVPLCIPGSGCAIVTQKNGTLAAGDCGSPLFVN